MVRKTAVRFILCLMTVFLIQSVLCFAESTESTGSKVAAIYETTDLHPVFEGDFQQVLEYANSNNAGKMIVLRSDVIMRESFAVRPLGDVAASIVIDGDVTVDLNGAFLTQISGSYVNENPLFIVPQGSSLVIKDSSDKGSGLINGVQFAVWVQGGSLTVDGGKIMAQSGALADFDSCELPVKITDGGYFCMNGGNIDFSGELTDGRTYADVSGAVYVTHGSTALINDGKIFGSIICEDESDVSVHGGTFSTDVSQYLSVVYESVEQDGMFVVSRKTPEVFASYNGEAVEAVLEEVFNKTGDRVEKYIITAKTSTLYRENTAVDISQVLQLIDDYEEARVPELEIQTDAITVLVRRETVRAMADGIGDKKVYFVSETDDGANDRAILKNARRRVKYSFADGDGNEVNTTGDFDVVISYVPEKIGDVINVYSAKGSALTRKMFDFSNDRIKYTTNKAETVLISDGYGMEILGKALDLQGTISMVCYAMPENLDINSVKMLFWISPQVEYTEKTAERIVSSSGKTANGYKFEYKNIASKDMNKEIYARLMAVGPSGEVIYSDVPHEGYSVRKYAQNMMKNEQLKPLLIKMLNYGAAAQEYFGSEEEMANSGLAAGERAIDFTKIYKSESQTIEENGGYGKSSARIIGKTLLLDGDISIKYYTDWENESGYDEAGILFWSENEFNSISNHVIGTESYKTAYFENNDSYRVYAYSNIVSSAMNEQIYARIYVRYGNEYKYSDIDSYSVRDYAANQLAKNSDEKLVKLLRTLMLYGEEAERYFKVETAE